MCRFAGKLGKGKGDQDMKPVSLKEIANRLDFLMDEWKYCTKLIKQVQGGYCLIMPKRKKKERKP